MLRHATSSIEEVVALGGLLGITHLRLLHDPRTFRVRILILLGSVALRCIRSAETFLGHLQIEYFASEANHVLVKFHTIDTWITPVEPCLTVIIDEYGRVDVVPRAILIQWFADGIAERTRRTVCHSHTDSHTAREARMSTDVPVKLAVALDALACPGAVVCPAEAFQCQRTSVVGPVHHVGRTIHAPLLHPEEVGIVFIMTRIDIDSVAMHHRSRVASKPGLYKWILCRCLQGKKRRPAYSTQ